MKYLWNLSFFSESSPPDIQFDDDLYTCLGKKLQANPPEMWTIHKLKPISILQTGENSDGNVVVTKQIIFDRNFRISIKVHGNLLSLDNPALLGLTVFGRILGSVNTVYDELLKLLGQLNTLRVCSGNFDDKFQDLVPIGVGMSQTKTSEGHHVSAYREGDYGMSSLYSGKIRSTIRSTSCSFMVDNSTERCRFCCRFHANLRARLSNQARASDDAKSKWHSHCTFKNLSTADKTERL